MTTPLHVIGILLLVLVLPYLYFVYYRLEHRLTTGQWARLTIVALLGGVLAGLAVVSLLAGLVLIALAVAWLWHRVILADVEYDRSFGHTHLFPDEETTITWTFRNEKPLGISWLRWQEAIPVRPFGGIFGAKSLELEGIDIRPIYDRNREGIDEVTSIGAFETVIKTATARALHRGYYRFGPVDWEASDALGLFTARLTIDDLHALTVYPRLFTSHPLELPVRALLGDIRRRQSLIEDPTWYRGGREYRSTDPMKTIDWLATARTHQLHVKTFEPAVHPKLMILCNLHAFERISEGIITEYMEDVISLAATTAKWGLEEGFEIGIHSNGGLPGTNTPVRLLPAAGQAQLSLILDYLAKIMLIVDRHVGDMVRRDVEDLPHGTTLLVCSNVVTQGLTTALTDVGRRTTVVLLLVDTDVPVSLPDVTVLRTHTPEEAAA